MTKRVLFVSYGSGHSKALIPVAKLLQKKKNIEVMALALTLAKKDYVNAGIKTFSSSDLLEDSSLEFKHIVKNFIPRNIHEDISKEDSEAYYITGFADLIRLYGFKEALEKITNKGRYSFYPIYSSTRFLQKIKPDLLVTSTCPRSELAFVNAAHKLKIKSLAISDLFLLNEENYVCKDNYADHLTVINNDIKKRILTKGCKSEVHVLGNPNFDNLIEGKNIVNREIIKKKYNISPNKKIVLWAMSPYEKNGNIFLSNKSSLKFKDIIDCLSSENFSRNYIFLIRKNPNIDFDFESIKSIKNFIFLDELTVKEALDISDLVLVEYSTVGLQAFIYGIPVIQIGNYLSAPYDKYKIARQALSTDKLKHLILENLENKKRINPFYPMYKSAERIQKLCLELLDIQNY